MEWNFPGVTETIAWAGLIYKVWSKWEQNWKQAPRWAWPVLWPPWHWRTFTKAEWRIAEIADEDALIGSKVSCFSAGLAGWNGSCHGQMYAAEGMGVHGWEENAGLASSSSTYLGCFRCTTLGDKSLFCSGKQGNSTRQCLCHVFLPLPPYHFFFFYSVAILGSWRHASGQHADSLWSCMLYYWLCCSLF